MELIKSDGQMFPKRNVITTLFALAKSNLTNVLESIIQNKILRVKVEDDNKFFTNFQKINILLNTISQKLSSIKFDVPETKLTLNVPSDEKLTSLTQEVGNLSEKTSIILIEISDLLGTIIKNLQDLKEGIPVLKFTPPQIQKVIGDVKITSMPKAYDFDKIVQSLQDVQFAISRIKIEVPKVQEIKIPQFPNTISLTESKLILKALKEVSDKLDQLPKRFPEMEFPQSVSINNFPPQKYPMPVTNININPLRGYTKSRTVTVTTTATPLPGEILVYRRSLIVYNNSSVTVFIGGSDVTTGNGLPIVASSFSPTIDAGSKLVVYGIVATGTADVRTLEASNENIGG